MKAMLSIKPEYVRRILAGEKTYEFRKRIFSRRDVDTIIIYTTRPVCQVLAEARITGILQDTPQGLWNRTHRGGGPANPPGFPEASLGESRTPCPASSAGRASLTAGRPAAPRPGRKKREPFMKKSWGRRP